jgi:hypothetical protein
MLGLFSCFVSCQSGYVEAAVQLPIAVPLLLLLLLLLLLFIIYTASGFSPGGSGTTIKYTIRHKQLMTLQTINDNKQLMA